MGTTDTNTSTEKLTPLAIIGIILLPYFFVWRLLKPGHSTQARLISFGWLALMSVALVAQTQKKEQAPALARQANESAPTAEPQLADDYFSGVAIIQLRNLLEPIRQSKGVKAGLEFYPMDLEGRHFISCLYSGIEQCGFYEITVVSTEKKISGPSKYNVVPGTPTQQHENEYKLLKVDTIAASWVNDKLPQSTLSPDEAKRLLRMQFQIPERFSLALQKRLEQDIPGVKVKLECADKDPTKGNKNLYVTLSLKDWLSNSADDKRRLMNLLIESMRNTYPGQWVINAVYVGAAHDNMFAEALWLGAKDAPTIKIIRE